MGNHLLILLDAKDATEAGRAELKDRLQRKLGLTDKVLEELFSQLPVIIRKGLEKEKAESFSDALEQLGAVVEIVEQSPSELGFEIPSETQAVDPAPTVETTTGSQTESQPILEGEVETTLHEESPPEDLDEETLPVDIQESSLENQPYDSELEPQENPSARLVKPIVILVSVMAIGLVLLIAFNPLGKKESKTLTKLKPSAYKQLLNEQQSIIVEKEDNEEADPPAAKNIGPLKLSGLVVLQGKSPDGELEAQSTFSMKDMLIEGIDFLLKQEPPPKITSKQLIDGFKHRPHLRKFSIKGIKPKIEGNSFSYSDKVYVYLADNDGTGRSAAILTLNGEIEDNRESISLKWSLKQGELPEAMRNSAERQSGDKFALYYSGSIDARPVEKAPVEKKDSTES